MTPSAAPTEELSHAAAMRGLTVVVVLALVVRWAGVGLDLWLDELATLIKVRDSTPGELLFSYTSANQHVLNSLGMWVTRQLFGEAEWALRLPALLFGVAGVPAMYWLARVARFTRGAALVAALLLALSYHHIWFSQNARGYTGYVCFSLLSTAAFLMLLRSPERRWLVIFALTSMLNFLALVPAAFVFGAQAIGGIVHAGAARRRGARDAAAERRLVVAVGCATAAGLLVYGPMLLEMVRVLSHTVPRQVTAMALPSLAFLREVVLGAIPGAGALLWVLVPVMAVIGGWGVVRLARQAPLVVGVLFGSQVLFAGAILVLGWPVYPRLFVLGLPLVLLVGVQVLGDLSVGLSLRRPGWRKPVYATGTVVLVAASVWLLPPLFTTPKQPFRAALDAAIRQGDPGDLIVAVGVAEVGIGHYAARRTDNAASRVRLVREVEEFRAAVGDRPPNQVIVVTTMDHALEVESPELWAAITEHWVRRVAFPGTVRRGAIHLWEAAQQ